MSGYSDEVIDAIVDLYRNPTSALASDLQDLLYELRLASSPGGEALALTAKGEALARENIIHW